MGHLTSQPNKNTPWIHDHVTEQGFTGVGDPRSEMTIIKPYLATVTVAGYWALRISEEPLLPDRETKIAGGAQDKRSGSAPFIVKL